VKISKRLAQRVLLNRKKERNGIEDRQSKECDTSGIQIEVHLSMSKGREAKEMKFRLVFLQNGEIAPGSNG
jgi:hypothetical protein